MIYIRLIIIATILAVGAGGYFTVKSQINKYNKAVTENILLIKEREMLKRELANSEKELQERIKRDKDIAKINVDKDTAIQQSDDDNDQRVVIIERVSNEKCVSAAVPKSVTDSLLSYAKERNSRKD